MSQTQNNNKKWDENRLANSRLENLAKAREAQKLARQQKEDGFSLSPVPNVQDSLAIPPLLHNDVQPLPREGEVESSSVINTMGNLLLALATLLVPVAINAAFDYGYHYYRQTYIEKPASSRSERNETAGYWQGQSIFR